MQESIDDQGLIDGGGPSLRGDKVNEELPAIHYSLMIIYECCFLLSACLDHCSLALKENPNIIIIKMTQCTFEIILLYCYIATGINKEAVPRNRKTSMEIRNEAAAAGAMEGKYYNYYYNTAIQQI